jgi:probable HAF family extracellular repeat protein
MWFHSLLDSLKSRSARATARPAQRQAARHGSATVRLRLEPLEDRCLLSRYSIQFLAGEPRDINARGEVVGASAQVAISTHAVLWRDGTMSDLGSLGGPSSESIAWAINDAGQVVGQSFVTPFVQHAFLVTPEDTDQDGVPDRWYRDDNQDGVNDLMTDLAPLYWAGDINNSGLVVGAVGHGVLWQNGTIIDLWNSSAYGINDAGQVVGYGNVDGGGAFLLTPKDTDGDGTPDCWYQDANSDGVNDLMVALNSDYPHGGRANRINAAGQVVGEDHLSGGFLWTPSEPNGTSGSLEYFNFEGADINASGDYVGTAWDWDWSFASSKWGALINLIPSDSGWSDLYTANAINDSGWIVGSGDHGGYLLVPTGEETLPALTISDATVTEGNTGTTNATFSVTLSAPSSQTVTVGYGTADGTATAGSDYEAASGTLIFAPGETTKIITVFVNGDRLGEPDETYLENLGSPTNATIADGVGIGTILDDEPRISIGDVTMKEGNSGTTAFAFTVSLSVVYDVPVTVSYATADGTATAGSDYQAASGTLTIPAGQTSGTISVLVNGDRLGEANETFFVNLSNVNYGVIADDQGVGTILDDEPRISISDVTRYEGKRGQTTLFVFTVTLSAAYDEAVTMSFRTGDGTAKTSDQDYVAKTGTLTFAPGETTKTITIVVNGDHKKEANETFYLDLFGNSGNSLFTKKRGLGTILNDD